MTNLKKVKDIMSLVVASASAVVALSKVWKEIGPEIKKILVPVFDECKKVACSESTAPAVIDEDR